MNWKEFKECIEKQGVNDDTKLDWIDVSFDMCRSVIVTLGPNNSAEISEDSELTMADLAAMQEGI